MYQIHRVVGDNIGLLLKAFKNQFVIPEFDTFCKQVSFAQSFYVQICT